jgi:hypothetical protein
MRVNIMVDKVCINCGKLKRHYAKGLCWTCYLKPRVNKEKCKEYSLSWRKKNPNYFKEYYLRTKTNKSKIENE